MTDLRTIADDLQRPALVEAGSPPMLQWVKIDLLRVDPRYQRDVRAENVRAINRIAEGFDWSKFSTVHVAPIEGGLYAIIDGQHRTHAARACGFEEVPCQITHMTLKQQASAFAAINGLTMRVTPAQIFRAAFAAGEPWAIELRTICEAAGCTIGAYNRGALEKKAGEVYALSYFRKLVAQRKAEPVTTALQILRKAEGVGDDIEFYTYALFRPILEAFASRPHALAEPARASQVLSRLDFEKLIAETDRFTRERRSKGLPAMGKVEILESLIGTEIDKRWSGGRAAA